MILWKRAAWLGVVSWLIPFAAGFIAFPLKRVNAPLFETAMGLVVLATAAALLQVHFRGRAVSAKEAAVVGACWLALNLALDYPMFAYGPMKMTAAAYYSEIGAGYLAFPLFGLGAAGLARR